jgi:ABC-type uncharacterized transport system ATPase subunit
VITLEGLSKRYGETRAVDALDLTVSPGRVTGFLGPNGAEGRAVLPWHGSAAGHRGRSAR